MPVMDSSYMLRDGSTNLDGNETGDGIKVGACPLGGMLAFFYVPSDGTTVTLTLQQSSDDGDSDAYEAIPGCAWTMTVGATDYAERVFWTEEYIRLVASSNTGDWGAVQVGLVMGGEPKHIA